jgi:cysteine desulfurase
VELAREQVARLFPEGGRVIFPSGATEALNLAIRGAYRAGIIAASTIEHSAVGDTARAVAPVHAIAVDSEGLSDPAAPLPENTSLITVMHVNNEIGTVQPVAEWAKRAREIGALFVCDAVQAYGKLAPVEADLIAISAHKLHGPKGTGALWVRDGVELSETQTGGGQEFGLRSGTLSPALVAGMGAAAVLAQERMARDQLELRRIWTRAREAFGGWTLNGSAEQRWHGNLNIRRDGLDVARLMSDCRDIMFSAGSACASGSGRPSHVLRAIGLTDAQAKSSIRLGFGRYTRLAEIEEAAAAINAAAEAQGL